jgi:putative FmdB family regulatory protein
MVQKLKNLLYNGKTYKMPTYEYKCDKCGYQFERFQSMTAEPLKRCPKCRCKVRRLLGTGAGLIFKGSGFYQTDYRSSSYQEGLKQEKKQSEIKSSKKDEKKSKSSDKKKAHSSKMKQG